MGIVPEKQKKHFLLNPATMNKDPIVIFHSKIQQTEKDTLPCL